MGDFLTDGLAFIGLEDAAPQMRESQRQIEAIQRKYGRLPDRLVGYSKGGAHALWLGDRFNIPSTNFNPLVGARQAVTISDTHHTIIRTMEDFASTSALVGQKHNYTVKGINPIKDVHGFYGGSHIGATHNDGVRRCSAKRLK